VAFSGSKSFVALHCTVSIVVQRNFVECRNLFHGEYLWKTISVHENGLPSPMHRNRPLQVRSSRKRFLGDHYSPSPIPLFVHATTRLLMALTCVCLTGHRPMHAGQGESPPLVNPLTIVYDFGQVKRSTLCKHAFRLVNTSPRPLRIVSLRVA